MSEQWVTVRKQPHSVVTVTSSGEMDYRHAVILFSLQYVAGLLVGAAQRDSGKPIHVGRVTDSSTQWGVVFSRPVDSAAVEVLQRVVSSFSTTKCVSFPDCIDLLQEANQREPRLRLPSLAISRQVACYIERREYTSSLL